MRVSRARSWCVPRELGNRVNSGKWYCRFYQGRRSADDARQVARWCACASERGRWRNQLCGRVRKAAAAAAASGGDGRAVRFDDAAVSPVIRQTLLHWAYELNEGDWDTWNARTPQ